MVGWGRDAITLQEYQWVTLTMFITFFLCWTAQEILERRCGMAPNIITAKDLHTKSATSTAANPMKHYVVNKRLTKSLDSRGEFRMQTRGTIYLIKAIWCFLLLVTYIVFAILDFEWNIQHYYHLNPSTAFFAPNYHFAGSVFAFYIWESTANRYGRLIWSVVLHHWLTAAAALAILLGRFSPFATWYLVTGVALPFPICIAFGFRAQFSNKYPNHTRSLFLFSYYWYIFTLILNFSGQIFIICNSLIYHFNESIPLYYVITFVLSMMAWLYDDIQLIKALYAFSKQNYEDAHVLNKQEEHPRVGGRSLFGQSVIKDLKRNKLLAMTTAEVSQLKEQEQENKDIAMEIPMKQITASAVTKTTSATLMKIEKLQTADFRAIQEESFMNEKDEKKTAVVATQLAMEISMKPITNAVTETFVMETSDTHTVSVVPVQSDDDEDAYLFTENVGNSAKNKMNTLHERDENFSNGDLDDMVNCIEELDSYQVTDAV